MRLHVFGVRYSTCFAARWHSPSPWPVSISETEGQRTRSKGWRWTTAAGIVQVGVTCVGLMNVTSHLQNKSIFSLFKFIYFKKYTWIFFINYQSKGKARLAWHCIFFSLSTCNWRRTYTTFFIQCYVSSYLQTKWCFKLLVKSYKTKKWLHEFNGNLSVKEHLVMTTDIW